MGHAKFENLEDLSSELNQIRNLAGIKEKKPGIFYFRAVPFLHFHDSDGTRWADIKVGKAWERMQIDFNASTPVKKRFILAILKAHQRFSSQGRSEK